ncbi:MAG: DUF1800 domain-containing protein [Terriglobia bacterium]
MKSKPRRWLWAPLRAGLAIGLAGLLAAASYAFQASAFVLRTTADGSEGSPSYALRATEGRPSYAPGSALGTVAGTNSTRSALTISDTGLSEDEQILHLLNRIGFGPRPGDIERVKQMGIAAYLEQQLHPESIPDQDVEERLADFKTLQMTTRELFAVYPPPQLLRAIEQRIGPQLGMDPDAVGSMFPELERFRERRERRQREQAGENAEKRPPKEEDPATRELRRFERMTPAERMKRAMTSPARIQIELSQAKLLRAVYSERQLQEVMTDFWFNHFNVFIGKGFVRWMTTSYEYEAIRPHALGKFRELLGATAQHPAMLFYLDNWLSADPNADYDQRQLRLRYFALLREQGMQPGGFLLEVMRQRGMDTTKAERLIARRMAQLDESGGRGARRGRRRVDAQQRRRPAQQQQRRRGLNENYARELLELHTLGVEGGYTQQDVIEVARCFTGWTMLPLQLGAAQFLYVDELHDQGTKVVLGHKIENGGQRDGESVLDLLARHPSTARFISTKLARRFVSDDPPPSLVEKMAQTFLATDGDIRAVLRTMFSAEEFWSRDAVRAKVKTPFEFVVSAARATEAELDELPPVLAIGLRGLGQPLYGAQPPTGYKDTADAWVSTGGMLSRMKIALGLAGNRLPGARVDLPRELLRSANANDELIAELSQRVLGREVSETTRQALEAELARAEDEIEVGGRQARARLALGLLLASPEFQRQ